MDRLERISITIEPDLLRAFDALVERAGHGNRSEAIRDLVRDRVSQGSDDPHAHVVGTLTMIYDHDRRELSDRLVAAGHAHHGLVLSTLHVHLDAHDCLEVVLLRGARADAQAYADHVLGMKGVRNGRLVLVPAG